MNVSTVTSCTVGKISVLPASNVQGKKMSQIARIMSFSWMIT